MSKQDAHEETYEILYETPEAILCKDGKNEFWLPKSKIEWERRGRKVDVVVPAWLAEQKGLI